MKPGVFLLILVPFLGGCATNNFARFYRDQTGVASADYLNESLKPFGGETYVITSNDLQRDTVELTRRGYVPLGEATFEAEEYDTSKDLKAQAGVIGADIVLYGTRLKSVESSSIAVSQPHDGQIFAMGLARAGNSTPVTLTGTPIVIPRYAYTAIFWRQGKPVMPASNLRPGA